MRSFITLRNQDRDPLPEGFAGPDIRYTKALVKTFLEEYTQVGDIVFDPFAGFGTTLIAAEEMGREGWGLELDPSRAEHVRPILRHPERLLLGDARRLDQYAIPSFDFSLTSPPYANFGDNHNPLSGYIELGDYAVYLADLGTIYREIAKRMKPEGRVVIEVSNLKGDAGLTTLAWDIAREVGKALTFEGEVVVGWEDGYGYGYDHSYCLVFAKPS